MEERKCPECGICVNNDVESCPQCGYPLRSILPGKNNQKKALILGTAIIAVIIGIMCAFLIPLQRSQRAFAAAQTYEETFDYESAILSYAQVIPRDSNYADACKKIEELTSSMETNKLVAKAFVALYSENIVSSVSSVSDFRSDGETVSCEIGGIGYIISDKTIGSTTDYTSTMTDSITGFHITKYEAFYMYNGWLTVTTNQIRQQTSDVMFEGARPDTIRTDINEDLIQHYVDMYNEEKDLTVFE